LPAVPPSATVKIGLEPFETINEFPDPMVVVKSPVTVAPLLS
jgi:hypothetical protein